MENTAERLSSACVRSRSQGKLSAPESTEESASLDLSARVIQNDRSWDSGDGRKLKPRLLGVLQFMNGTFPLGGFLYPQR